MEMTGRLAAELVIGVTATIAIGAGLADRRHRKRADLDRVAMFDWRGVQVLALIGAIISLGLAIHL